MNVSCSRFFELTAETRARGHLAASSGAANSETTMTEQRKAVIKNADMSEDMQQEAVDCASQALSKYNIEKVSERGGGQDTAETAAMLRQLAGIGICERGVLHTWVPREGTNNSQRGFAVQRVGGW